MSVACGGGAPGTKSVTYILHYYMQGWDCNATTKPWASFAMLMSRLLCMSRLQYITPPMPCYTSYMHHAYVIIILVLQHCATTCRGVRGHAPPGKFWFLDHMRVLLRPLEATITMQIYCNYSVVPRPHKKKKRKSQAIQCMIVSRSPFPSESAFVFAIEALPQNGLLGAADWVLYVCRTWSSDLYRDVHGKSLRFTLAQSQRGEGGDGLPPSRIHPWCLPSNF